MPNEQTKDVVFSLGDLSADQSTKSWFYGIGINKYRHFNQLNNAVKDVEDVLALLEERYELDEKIILLDEQATRDNITNQLESLGDKVGTADRVIIYFSGHGFLKNETGYWIPVDAEPDKRGSFIRNETIQGCIKDLPAKHILLISDACFSGALVTRDTYDPDIALEELEKDRSRWVLSSGRQTEKVADGPPGKNSPFATSVLKVLRDNQSPRLNVGYVADKVVKLTRYNWEQMPQGSPLFGVGHEGGQYVFRLKAGEQEAWAVCEKENSVAAYQLFLQLYPTSARAASAREQLNTLQEEAAWENARRENTILAYFHYDRTYPNGRYSRQALSAIQELEEEQAWQEARRSNKLSAFQKYLIDYPAGKYRADAGASIEQIVAGQEEPALWEKTRQQNTVAAFEAYLVKYPEGRYAVEACEQLKELQVAEQEKEARRREEKAWEQAKRENTDSAYLAFLRQFPQGAFAGNARSAVDKILAGKNREEQERRARQQQEEQEKAREKREKREQSDWDRAVREDSIASLRAYLQNHPQGSHAAAARRRLTELQGAKQQAQLALLKKHARWAAPLLLVLIIFTVIKVANGGRSPGEKLLTVFQDSKTNKFGYQNAKGKMVIAAIYDQAGEFVNGMARVESGDSAFLIDRNGLWVQSVAAPADPAEADRNTWLAAEEKGEREAFQAYLDQFPDGAYRDKAQEKIRNIEQAVTAMANARNDQQAWEAAKKQNTVSAYEAYQRAYRNGKYYGEATRRIRQLQEENDWQLAVQRNTVYAYTVYTQKYPKGTYYSKAQERIKELGTAAWQAAQRENTITAYVKFSLENPTSPYREEADKQAQILQAAADEEQAWKEAVSKNTVVSYKTYQAKYPSGKYDTEASQKIKELSVIPPPRPGSGLQLRGVVKDTKGNPLIGVSIRIKGTKSGSFTDPDGVFMLDLITGKEILEISYIGYQTQEVGVDGRSNIAVTLKLSY